MEQGSLSVVLHRVPVLSAPGAAPLWPLILCRCLPKPRKDCGCCSGEGPKERKAKLPREKQRAFPTNTMRWAHSADTGEVVFILINVVSSGRNSCSTGKLSQLYILIFKKCIKHNQTCYMQRRPVCRLGIWEGSSGNLLWSSAALKTHCGKTGWQDNCTEIKVVSDGIWGSASFRGEAGRRDNHTPEQIRSSHFITLKHAMIRSPLQHNRLSSEVPFGKLFHNELFRTHSDAKAVNVTAIMSHTHTPRCELAYVCCQQAPLRPEIPSLQDICVLTWNWWWWCGNAGDLNLRP